MATFDPRSGADTTGERGAPTVEGRAAGATRITVTTTAATSRAITIDPCIRRTNAALGTGRSGAGVAVVIRCEGTDPFARSRGPRPGAPARRSAVPRPVA